MSVSKATPSRINRERVSVALARWFRVPVATHASSEHGHARDVKRALHFARAGETDVYNELASSAAGLGSEEAAARLRRDGPNAIVAKARQHLVVEILQHLWTPLNLILLALAAVSYLLGDSRAAVTIACMVVLSAGLSFWQEHRSTQAAEKLKAMVRTTATVKRAANIAEASFGANGCTEMRIEELVVGDIVMLAAGDLVPADVRLLSAKDLYVNQSMLTGESLPAEKAATVPASSEDDPFAMPNLCFMGTNVVSGSATAIVFATGRRTVFGDLARSIAGHSAATSFELGIQKFVWLMVRVMVVMVPVVFLLNGLTKGDWFQALLFAVAVAVGLTPEMLPMVVTMNLAKGSYSMARRKVIVKRLSAIQNLGAMDVLCTDKTGTLTQDRIILKLHLDINGNESDRVLEYAYLNSHFQSGLKNLLDVAVLKHVDLHRSLDIDRQYQKIDEVPFDFERRRMSVVVARADGTHVLICKGAVEEIMAVCTRCQLAEGRGILDTTHLQTAKDEMAALNNDGFRVVAVAYKEYASTLPAYSVKDECDLTLLGYIAFLDPPKESAAGALKWLADAGACVKVLTGDNPIITRKICKDVGFQVDRIVLGSELENLASADFDRTVATANVFAKLSPAQKALIVESLRRSGHVVGFLGDGINDGPALKAADVGISVDTAVDIAKDSADIILLEKSLAVLSDGVREGRRVFGNIIKYLKMGASSNFGNMLSVLGASVLLPFLPMAPIQVLVNNLLYDFSQTTIPTDGVDDEYLARPRRWDIDNILRFMLVMGPVSSLFDYTTFFAMLYLFHAIRDPALLQTGWFVESLLTQTLVIHVIRTARVPFVQSRASTELMFSTVVVAAIGCVLPFTGIGAALGLKALPSGYWGVLIATLVSYVLLAHWVKSRFMRRFGLD